MRIPDVRALERNLKLCARKGAVSTGDVRSDCANFLRKPTQPDTADVSGCVSQPRDRGSNPRSGKSFSRGASPLGLPDSLTRSRRSARSVRLARALRALAILAGVTSTRLKCERAAVGKPRECCHRAVTWNVAVVSARRPSASVAQTANVFSPGDMSGGM